MGASNYKIGQIASRMRISVRTLRHYDAIGLLRPSCRTATGQRLYSDREVTRLRKIVALRRMGFSLDHARTILAGDTQKAYAVLETQAQHLRAQIARQQEILTRVEIVLGIGTTLEAQFTEPEMDAVKKQSADLREALALEIKRGTHPKDPRVQELVQQLDIFGEVFPDAEIEWRSSKRFYTNAGWTRWGSHT